MHSISFISSHFNEVAEYILFLSFHHSGLTLGLNNKTSQVRRLPFQPHINHAGNILNRTVTGLKIEEHEI